MAGGGQSHCFGQTVLRHDSTGRQFIQNWQVPRHRRRRQGSCYTATMTTLDGSSLTGYFKTREPARFQNEGRLPFGIWALGSAAWKVSQ